MDTSICPNCGYPNPPETARCQNCGADLQAGVVAEIPGEIRGSPPALKKVRLTPAQQVHSRLLQEVLSEEGKPAPLPSKARRPSYTTWRVGVGSVLSLILIASLLTNRPVFTQPALTPETLEARQLIYTLTPGAPVLVAFDYQPGFNAEMMRIAQGVVVHVLAQGAFPVFISTHPTGPAQAEIFLSDIEKTSSATYSTPEQYLNLGYLPGGSAGLLSFSQAPKRIMPLTVEGSQAWHNPAVQNIENLADFSMVLVITEDPDTARDWIEQAQPLLEGKPLLLLLSAQAGPMLHPYLGTPANQVQGIVSGVAEGVAYQDSAVFTLSGDTSGVPWSTYSLGLWAGAVLLLLAGIFALAKLAKDQDSELPPEERQP